MDKVAIVTGGYARHRCGDFQGPPSEAGCTVAANYGGNDEAANAFKEEDRHQVYKWDVGDFEACADGIAQVEAISVRSDIVVNNAGITRDGMLHKMTAEEQWSTVISTNLDSLFNMCRGTDRRHARARLRPDHLDLVDQRPEGPDGPDQLLRRQGRRDRVHQGVRPGDRAQGHHVNCICPGYINTDMVAAVPEKVLESIIAGIPVGRLGEASEIADAVVYLAREESGFITGSVMTINGGQYMANG